MANCCDPKAPRVFQIQVGDGPVGITNKNIFIYKEAKR